MHKPTTEITRISQFLISLRLKTEGIRPMRQLSTGDAAAGPKFNFIEIKKGPSRTSTGVLLRVYTRLEI